jgi:hypothetical protein
MGRPPKSKPKPKPKDRTTGFSPDERLGSEGIKTPPPDLKDAPGVELVEPKQDNAVPVAERDTPIHRGPLHSRDDYSPLSPHPRRQGLREQRIHSNQSEFFDLPDAVQKLAFDKAAARNAANAPRKGNEFVTIGSAIHRNYNR